MHPTCCLSRDPDSLHKTENEFKKSEDIAEVKQSLIQRGLTKQYQYQFNSIQLNSIQFNCIEMTVPGK